MKSSPKHEEEDGVITSMTFHKITEELDRLASFTIRDLDYITDKNRKRWMLDIRVQAIKLISALLRAGISTESGTVPSPDEIRAFRRKFRKKGVRHHGSAGWLAEQLGVSRRLVEAWEAGERAPLRSTLKLLKLFMNLNQ